MGIRNLRKRREVYSRVAEATAAAMSVLSMVIGLSGNILLAQGTAAVPNFEEMTSLPVEYATDLLIGIVDAHKLPTKQEIALIRDLFRRADQATDQFPLLVVPLSRSGDQLRGPVRFLVSTAQMTDGITIRLRLIQRLKQRDQKVARELLSSWKPPPVPQPSGCQDGTIPTVGEYYSTIQRVYGDSYSLSGDILSSPQQLAAVMSLLANAPNLTQVTLETGARLTIDALKRMSTTDRVFATVEARLLLGENIGKVVSLARIPLPSRVGIAAAYREYLIRHLKAPRCGDLLEKLKDKTGEFRIIDTIGQSSVANYNRMASQLKLLPMDAKPLSAQQMVSAPPKSGKLSGLGDKKVIAAADSYTAERSAAVRLILENSIRNIGSWQPIEGCDYCSFLGQIGMLLVITERSKDVTDDALADEALAIAIRILKFSSLKKTDPASWMLACKQVLNLLHSPNPAVASMVGNALRKSDDPELVKYAEVEQVLRHSTSFVEDAVVRFYTFPAVF